MGCVVALRLCQRGYQAVVLERGIPGAEASSAAAGILGPQWESEGPGALLSFGLASRGLYAAFAEELAALSGIDIGYRQSGLIELALDEAGRERLEERDAWMRSCGLTSQILDAHGVRELEPSVGPSACAGNLYPDEGHVSARALARALSQAAAAEGAEFLQGRYVRKVSLAKGRACGLQVDDERLEADAVVIAAGSWSSLVEGAGVEPGMVSPARGQALAVQMRPPIFNHVVAPLDRGYLVPRADGMAIIGSTLEMVGYRKEVTVAGLSDILTMARTVMPALGPLPVAETWANFRPFTQDHMPVLGRTPVEGLFLATGHHRYGILHTPMTGQSIAELIDEGRTTFDLSPFSVSRFR